MKRILKSISLIFILLLTFIPKNIYAADGFSVNKTSMTVYKGGSSTFTIVCTNAAGRVDISSSDKNIATVNTSSVFIDSESGRTKSQAITVKGVNFGTCTITIRLNDAATYKSVDLTGRTYTINVKVSDAPSSNNNFASFGVENFEITEVDQQNYTLSVGKLVDSININATAADPDASISGAGTQLLNEGKNVFQISCIAASGAKKTYTLTVERLNSYFLSDLEGLLEKGEENIQIMLAETDGALTKSQVNLIKEKKQNITFNSNRGYHIILDASQINIVDVYRLNYILNYKDASLDLASNYAKGININLNGSKLPKGATLYLDTTNQFDDGALVDVYSWDPASGKLVLLMDEVEVKDGQLELSDLQTSHLFITSANIADTTMNFNLLTYVFLAATVIELIVIIVLVTPKNKNRNF